MLSKCMRLVTTFRNMICLPVVRSGTLVLKIQSLKKAQSRCGQTCGKHWELQSTLGNHAYLRSFYHKIQDRIAVPVDAAGLCDL